MFSAPRQDFYRSAEEAAALVHLKLKMGYPSLHQTEQRVNKPIPTENQTPVQGGLGEIVEAFERHTREFSLPELWQLVTTHLLTGARVDLETGLVLEITRPSSADVKYLRKGRKLLRAFLKRLISGQPQPQSEPFNEWEIKLDEVPTSTVSAASPFIKQEPDTEDSLFVPQRHDYAERGGGATFRLFLEHWPYNSQLSQLFPAPPPSLVAPPRCGNCHRIGHRVQQCIAIFFSGQTSGCPYCNAGHMIAECPHKDAWRSQWVSYLFHGRKGLPQLNSGFNVYRAALLEFGPDWLREQGGGPMTKPMAREWAKTQHLDYTLTHDYQNRRHLMEWTPRQWDDFCQACVADLSDNDKSWVAWKFPEHASGGSQTGQDVKMQDSEEV